MDIVEELLQPISDENPLGENLRLNNDFSNLYHQLKSRRQHARSLEKQRSLQGDEEVFVAAEWKEIEISAIKILKNQSKDLEIGSWLVEAWVRIDSFEGLVNGLDLLTGMIRIFGDYFSQDLERLEQQLSTMQGLSGIDQPGTLIIPLMSQDITQSADGKNYPTWQYQHAIEILHISDENIKSKLTKQGNVELSTLQQASNLTSEEFKTKLKKFIVNSFASLAQCEEAIRVSFPEYELSWHFLRQTLESIQQAVNSLYSTKKINSVANQELENTKIINQTVVEESFQERNSALSAISKAANYFLVHEPHSPVIYLLQQAVRWSNMSLPEMMQEIFPDQGAYLDYCRITGIPIERN